MITVGGVECPLSLLFPPFASRRVGIAAIVADHLFMVSGDVGGDPGDPVQGIYGASQAFGGAVLDVRVVGVVTDSSTREAGTQN